MINVLKYYRRMHAVFPLDIVILPEETVALHLFEPRYRELFSDHKNGKEFVILYQNKGDNSKVGTLVTIDQVVNEFPDGTVDIIVTGVQGVEIVNFEKRFPNKLYSGVEVKRLNLLKNANEKLISEFEKYLVSIQKYHANKLPLGLYYIANRLKLPYNKKSELLSISSEKQANNFLLNEIKFFRNIREQEALLNHNFHLN